MLRRAFVLLVALALVFLGSHAFAEQAPRQPRKAGDGGLHVSNGGSVAYVGGSGSISGNVVGPGSGGGSARSKPAVEPNAIDEGAVAPVSDPIVVTVKPTQAASAERNIPLALWIGAPIVLALITAVFARRRRPNWSPEIFA
jgi:hypothetical protein